MQYKYGVIDNGLDGIIVKAAQLIDLIKRDVNRGKWNVYDGGDNKHTAKISYKGKNWEYGEHIYIRGSENEFKYLEQELSKFMEVNPRQFN